MKNINYIFFRFKKKILSLLDLIYPRFCLNCRCQLKKDLNFFCLDCLEHFSLMQPVSNQKYFAAFENIGPVRILVKELQKQNLDLYKASGGYMVYQLERLSWPDFDYIVPVFQKKIKKDHRYYLAKTIAKILNKRMKMVASKEDKVLFITDIVSLDIYNKVTNKYQHSQAYLLGLCFDVSFDHFNLSG